ASAEGYCAANSIWGVSTQLIEIVAKRLGLRRRRKIKYLIRGSGQGLFVLNTAANNSLPQCEVLGHYFWPATLFSKMIHNPAELLALLLFLFPLSSTRRSQRSRRVTSK